ncbi:proline-rich protein 5-like [Leptonychotes weddellii]|uniref:Proline-rich protein 5-like n=1 Tax=Leptonychotes weddellii TaxID=9713 RepID=A0A7F8Q8Y2_LEPWE|nr:proline-rich protein 5-like [Leptonychotes weddellii]
MTRGFAPSLPTEFHKMGSFRRPRPRFMSSPVLSDLPRFQAARQALQLSSNSAWNSVQTAVINVFKGGGLQSNELYALNENIRTSFLQKACCLWRRRLSCVKGQELTIRQISLLGFRDLVLLKVKLGDLLLLAQSQPPSSIVQMLLILQSVHEPTGPSEGYLQLEELVKQVVSPFLGISEDRGVLGPTSMSVFSVHFPVSDSQKLGLIATPPTHLSGKTTRGRFSLESRLKWEDNSFGVRPDEMELLLSPPSPAPPCP